MPDIRSPNIDFTLNTPGNRLVMTTSITETHDSPLEIPVEIGFTFAGTPVLNAGGGGGGGPVTYSTPITG